MKHCTKNLDITDIYIYEVLVYILKQVRKIVFTPAKKDQKN